LFCEHSNFLQDGTYIFVAKSGLFDSSHQQLKKEFKKVLHRAKMFKEEANV